MVSPRGALAAWSEATPQQPAGPFYAPFKPLSIDNDLVLLPGHTQAAAGQVIHVGGRVLDQTGEAIAGARVEIWQANTHGRYNYPRHRNSRLPLDPNFQGFGHDSTDAGGAYGFRTIKPGPYPDSLRWIRPPHIHFLVVPPAGAPWTTQMYFAGEALNDTDFLLNAIPAEARPRVVMPLLVPSSDQDAASRRVSFDIVLGMPGVERTPT
jgi:protocatechuate 3,4-dioxygenase beta subunit